MIINVEFERRQMKIQITFLHCKEVKQKKNWVRLNANRPQSKQLHMFILRISFALLFSDCESIWKELPYQFAPFCWSIGRLWVKEDRRQAGSGGGGGGGGMQRAAVGCWLLAHFSLVFFFSSDASLPACLALPACGCVSTWACGVTRTAPRRLPRPHCAPRAGRRTMLEASACARNLLILRLAYSQPRAQEWTHQRKNWLHPESRAESPAPRNWASAALGAFFSNCKAQCSCGMLIWKKIQILMWITKNTPSLYSLNVKTPLMSNNSWYFCSIFSKTYYAKKLSDKSL
jgi:hypothetical protein